MDPTMLAPQIVWNDRNIRKITKVSASPEAKVLINKYGHIILKESRAYLPHQTKKRYSKYTPLRDAFITTDPKIKKVRYEDQTIESYNLRIRPKVMRVYYKAALWGHIFKNNWHYKFKFTDPRAVTQPIERTTGIYKWRMQDELKVLAFKKVKETADTDNKI